MVENIIVLREEDFYNFVPYKSGIELAPRHDGEIGWRWSIGINDWIRPTPAPTSTDALAQRARIRRNNLLKKHVDYYNPLRWADLSPEQQSLVSDYRRALLDITDQPGFPLNIQWPQPPQV